jgi:hypothetical protein
MIPRAGRKYVVLALLFAFCQVIGAMCALPDLSATAEAAIVVEEGMVCPMEGSVMCPPSAASSPERQVKNGAAIGVADAPMSVSLAAVLTSPSVPTLWSWSSICSPVPTPIGFSSVLRI